MFDGVTAFTLYDTYGFPLDLTQDALRPRGIGVDIASFTDAMDASARRRAARGPARARRPTRRCGSGCVKSSVPPNFSVTRPRPPQASWSRWCATARKCALHKGESGAVVLIKLRSTPNPAARSATPAR